MNSKLLLLLAFLGISLASGVPQARLLGGPAEEEMPVEDNDHADFNIHLRKVESHAIEINLGAMHSETIKTKTSPDVMGPF